jgi:hypothetical protein
MTLFDHLIMIFDRVTSAKYSGFGQYDFVQVETARRLEFTYIIDSINKLNSQVKAIKSYHDNFKKLAPNDRLGSLLDENMTEFFKEVGNLLHVSYFRDQLHINLLSLVERKHGGKSQRFGRVLFI